jgi:hypothetical protein
MLIDLELKLEIKLENDREMGDVDGAGDGWMDGGGRAACGFPRCLGRYVGR